MTTTPESEEEPARDRRTGDAAAAARMQHQALWVDLQIQRAMERGEFDNLPGHGKPIEDLGSSHDPDWWLKRLVEREKISVLPPSLQVRKDDADLDDLLDGLATESQVSTAVEEFNQRVLKARIQPLGGPPMITRLRDVDAELAAWSVRRAERLARRKDPVPDEPPPRRRGWFRRT